MTATRSIIISMPELPEVELIARSLDHLISGRRILTAQLLRARLAPHTTPGKFAAALAESNVNFVHRRGKHILIDLDNGRTLIVHLRMSGRFSLLPVEETEPKFTHALFHLDGDEKLVFDDQRHFGLMKIVTTAKLHQAKELSKLAPEPFSDEFTPAYLHSALNASKLSLKEFLLDQTKVTGLGNIYASEAMFHARLHPAMKTRKVSRPRAALLFESIRSVLQAAISGAELLNVDPRNLEGNYFSQSDDPQWVVYDREGAACVNCKTPISRLKQGGRSTYFCRNCQKR